MDNHIPAFKLSFNLYSCAFGMMGHGPELGKDEQAEDISMMFGRCAIPPATSVQSDRNRNFWGSVPKSAVVGFRISQ